MVVEFVDTNILIYAYDSTSGVRHQQANSLLDALWNKRNGAISTQVLQEFYVNVTRKIPQPLSPQQASQIISDYSVWKVARPDVSSILNAIRSAQLYQVSFWDAMILAAAREMGARVVWSEDLNSGQDYDGVKVHNPFS
ncbi:MAG: PIN domain-containing protein [Vulcanimicrobiota bacterium]